MSDHNLIGVIVRLKGVNNESMEHMKRSKKTFDPVIYSEQIGNINWEKLYECTNIDVANAIFEEEILNILNVAAPMIKSQPQKTPSNWVSDETRNFMALRDLAKDIASKSQNANDWNLYRRLRNKCTLEVSKNRKLHLKKMSDILCQKKTAVVYSIWPKIAWGGLHQDLQNVSCGKTKWSFRQKKCPKLW